MQAPDVPTQEAIDNMSSRTGEERLEGNDYLQFICNS